MRSVVARKSAVGFFGAFGAGEDVQEPITVRGYVQSEKRLLRGGLEPSRKDKDAYELGFDEWIACAQQAYDMTQLLLDHVYDP
jgi:hypothetical protein